MRPDIQAALEQFEVNTFGNGKNIERTESLVAPDEKVKYITPTNAIIHNLISRKKDKLPGIIVVTDKRIIFHYKALASHSTEVTSLGDVISISCNGNGMSGGHVIVTTQTKEMDFLVKYKKDNIQRAQSVLQQAVDHYKNNSQQPDSAGNDDALEKIRKLSDLRAANILSEEEFQAKKAELLSRL